MNMRTPKIHRIRPPGTRIPAASTPAVFLAALICLGGTGSQILAQNITDNLGATGMATPVVSPVAIPAVLSMTEQSISIQQLAASAQDEAESVADAVDAYEAAAKAIADSAAWKKAAAKLEGSWMGNFLEEPATSPDARTYTAWGSLSMPVIASTGLSLNVTGQAILTPDSQASAGANVSWSPFAVDSAGLKLDLELELAGIRLDAARKEAAIAAMEAFMETISAEANRYASGDVLERARTALAQSEEKAARGELGAAALARARAAVPKAEASYNKNTALAANERRLLAELAGGSLGKAISAGALLDLDSINALIHEEWTVPAETNPAGNVLEAQAALAREEASSWFGDTAGPLTLSAALSTTGAFSLAGSLNLDYKTLSGQHFLDRQDRLADAREALDDALEAQSLAREQAILDAEIARLSLIEAEATAVAANLDLAQAQVLHRLGELLSDDLAEEEEKAESTRLAVILARLELAKARLELE
jgi:hypothetical protein